MNGDGQESNYQFSTGANSQMDNQPQADINPLNRKLGNFKEQWENNISRYKVFRLIFTQGT